MFCRDVSRSGVLLVRESYYSTTTTCLSHSKSSTFAIQSVDRYAGPRFCKEHQIHKEECLGSQCCFLSTDTSSKTFDKEPSSSPDLLPDLAAAGEKDDISPSRSTQAEPLHVPLTPSETRLAFKENWIHRKANLLSINVGAFQPHDWIEATKLLNVIHRPQMAVDPENLDGFFQILERLCKEILKSTTAAVGNGDSIDVSAIQEDYSSIEQDRNGQGSEILEPAAVTTDIVRDRIHDNVLQNEVSSTEEGGELRPGPLLPFPSQILDNILLKWRRYQYSTVPTNKSSSTMSFLLKQRLSRFDLEANKNENATVSPAAVLQYVQQCTQAGLFVKNASFYNVILDVMAKVGHPKQAPYEADNIFRSMLADSPSNKAIHPTAETIQHVVDIWAKSRLPESPIRDEAYLQQLQNWFEQSHLPDFRPSTKIFCSVMEAHSRCSEPSLAFERIQELLNEMKSFCNSSELDSKAYTRVCHAFANCRHPKSPDAARAILDEMFTRQHSYPTQHTFSAVLTAYGRAGRLDDAEALLSYMEDIAGEIADRSLRPNAVCFSTLVWACARAGDAQRAEALLPRMVATMEKYGADMELYEETLTGVLTSWARSGERDATERVALIIQQLENFLSQQNSKYTLSVSTYNTLLTCYAQHQTGSFGMRLANDLLRWMEQQENEVAKPNEQSYLSMMCACWNAKEPEQCDKWLRTLLSNVREGVMRKDVLTQQHFNTAIAAWADSKSRRAGKKASAVFEQMKYWGVPPDVISYNSLFSAWAHSQEAEADEEMERLLSEMRTQWKKRGDSFLKPDQRTYNSFLLRLSTNARFTLKDVVVAERAKSILRRMELDGIRPNNVNYNTLMKVWSARQRPNRVEDLFQKMKRGFEAGDESLKPHFEAYTNRLQAWSDAGEPEMAARVLGEMIYSSSVPSSKFGSLMCDGPVKPPTTRDFNAVLQAWLRSNRPGRAASIEKCLVEMKQYASEQRYDCRPDAFSFTIAISAYHKNRNNKRTRLDADVGSPGSSTERIWQLFQELKEIAKLHPENKAFQPNETTYSAVLVGLLQSENDKVALKRADELEIELRERLKMNPLLYKMLLELWSRIPKPEKAEEIFQDMKKRFEEENDTNLKPGYNEYDLRLQAWSKAGDPEMATKVLGEMLSPSGSLGCSIRTKDLNAVLVAWKRSNRPDAAEKAEEVLRTMLKFAEEKRFDCLPDAFSFTTVISAYAESLSPVSGQKAWQLLHECKSLAQRQQGPKREKRWSPNLATYAAAVVAIARAGGDSSAELAVWKLLEELRGRDISFWTKEALRGVGGSIERVREALHHSSFPSKLELMREFSLLEQTARVKHSH